MNAPEIFDQRDDDGVVVLLDENPPAEQAENARKQPRPVAPHWPSTSRSETCPTHSPARTTEAISDVPEYPMARAGGCPFAPAAGRDGAGRGAAAVQGADLGRQHALADHRLRSRRARCSPIRGSASTTGVPGFPHWNEGMLSTVHKRPRSVFTSDAEEHTRFRRMLSKPFTFKRVEGLRPAIQQITDDTIDAMLAGPQPADIVTALALPVPSLVISQLLGVPYEDAEMFQHHANVGLARYATAEDTAEGRDEPAQVPGAARRGQDGDHPGSEDAVSDLAERVKAGELSVKEAAQLGTGLLIAGHETTANMIGLGVLALLQHPDQAAVLRDADDPKVVANAVEELLRYSQHHPERPAPRRRRRHRHRRRDHPGRRRHHHRPGAGQLGRGRHSPNPTGCTCTARAPTATSHSATAGTSASASSLPARNCRSSSTRCFAAFPTLELAVPIEDIPFKHDRLAYGVYELPVTW